MDNKASPTPQGRVPKKDDHYWLDDGNIVLIANNAVAFRVYKGLLARISPVFQDMFSMAQPNDVEKMEGCAVVRLQDHPQDLRAFLKIVMGMPPHALLERFPVSFKTIAGIIRCAHKYQAENVAHYAGLRLRQAFRMPQFNPLLLAPQSWKQVWARWKADGHAFPDMELHDAIEAVSLLRLIHTDAEPTVLPLTWALYLCVLCGPEALMEATRSDGEITARLSSDDYVLCMKASLGLTRDCYRGVQLVLTKLLESLPGTSPFSFGSAVCKNPPGQCKEAVTQMARKQATEKISYTLFDLFIHVGQRSSVSKAYTECCGQLCSICQTRLHACFSEVTAELLRELPSYFSLPAPPIAPPLSFSVVDNGRDRDVDLW